MDPKLHLVMAAMTNEDRRYIAELCRQHDALMAEHEAWMAAREAPPASSARKSDAAGIAYRDGPENAPAAAATGEPQVSEADWSQWEAWLAGHLANERKELLDIIARATSEFIAVQRREIRKERDIELIELRREVAVMRGRINMLIDLLHKDGGHVIDLPRGFWKGDHVA
jgi:hypothetical protein